MAYVVAENCVKCKYTSCVDICPVDAFRDAPLKQYFMKKKFRLASKLLWYLTRKSLKN